MTQMLSRVGLFALVLASTALGPHAAESRAVVTPARVAEFDFDDDLGQTDPQGWRPLVESAQEEAYFHVEDFSGAGHTASALDGNASMWCGLTAEDPRTCNWVDPPGYGNSWAQNLTSVEFPVVGDVTLGFLMDVGNEPFYDYVLVQYQGTVGTWTTLDSYSCYCGTSTQSYVVPAAAHDGTIRFRFFFASDGAVSNEYPALPTHTAFVVDDLTVNDDTGVVDSQDFETESIGDGTTADGHWYAEVNMDALNAGGLVDGATVLQESVTQNDTNFWAFLEGSTMDYGCAGHPEQATTEEIANIVRSPRIDLTHDADGHPIEGSLDSIRVAFDVYRDIASDQQKWYTWRVVSYSDDCLLESPGASYHQGDQKDWYRHTVVLVPPAGTTQVVLELGVLNVNLVESKCYSHAPLFDNVSVERFGGTVTAAQPVHPPVRPVLRQNHPNPFNPVTKIEYEVPTGVERVQLRVFDAGAGWCVLSWTGRRPPGRRA